MAKVAAVRLLREIAVAERDLPACEFLVPAALAQSNLRFAHA